MSAATATATTHPPPVPHATAGVPKMGRKGGTVTVRVPATTANLGPGFDCLGLALDVWQHVTFTFGTDVRGVTSPSTAIPITVRGLDAAGVPLDASNLVLVGFRRALAYLDAPVPPGLSVDVFNTIPVGKGFGSSAAALVAGIMGGLAVAGGLDGRPTEAVDRACALRLAAAEEGHADNAAACVHGGLQLVVEGPAGAAPVGAGGAGSGAGAGAGESSAAKPSGAAADADGSGSTFLCRPVPVPPTLAAVLLVPAATLSTEKARGVLKRQVALSDAVFNLSRTALLVRAFAMGDLDDLRIATQDALHQDARASLMPHLQPAVAAALAAGAKGASLSGAGTSVVAFVDSSDPATVDQVAAAMEAASAASGAGGVVLRTKPSTSGASVAVSAAPPSDTVAYVSTRDTSQTPVGFRAAVMAGLAPDGGLYVPTAIPRVDVETLRTWSGLSYPELAVQVLQLFIPSSQVPADALASIVRKSYARFTDPEVVPMVSLGKEGAGLYLLELFHGPTCAFKDVALQFLGNLFDYFLEHPVTNADGSSTPTSITVLGATSGDTGGAAIEALRGKPNIPTCILHPAGRVSRLQALQMTSVLDANIHNAAVEGTFDDCQTMVKTLFREAATRSELHLAAINSINWARILAQVVYYFYTYLSWATGRVNKLGETGADFGRKPTVATLAPAMDIVIPSNFERYLFDAAWRDPHVLRRWMAQAAGSAEPVLEGLEAPDTPLMSAARATFVSASADDAQLKTVIRRFMDSHRLLLCPHSAAGMHAALRLKQPGEAVVCLATAHPAKFSSGAATEAAASGVTPAVPPQIASLEGKPTRCASLPHSVDAVREFVRAAVAT